MQIIKLEKVTCKHEVIKKVICDMCGAESQGGHWGPEKKQEFIMVECWPVETGSFKREGYDICSDCFHKKIVPFIKNTAKHKKDRQ